MTTETKDETLRQLESWQDSLVTSIPLGGLYSRNPVAYKWKTLHRCWLLRETLFWRMTDLLKQSHTLYRQRYLLGARILLRSALETLASLIYSSHCIRMVLHRELNFHKFSEKTAKLLLGSKIDDRYPDAVNVLTMLDRADKKYHGVRRMYDNLSETAHPNFDGLFMGYAKVDHEKDETNLSNRWEELFGEQHIDNIEICMLAFTEEYNVIWPQVIEDLECWIQQNDAMLEATKAIPTDS